MICVNLFLKIIFRNSLKCRFEWRQWCSQIILNKFDWIVICKVPMIVNQSLSPWVLWRSQEDACGYISTKRTCRSGLGICCQETACLPNFSVNCVFQKKANQRNTRMPWSPAVVIFRFENDGTYVDMLSVRIKTDRGFSSGCRWWLSWKHLHEGVIKNFQ